MPRVENRRKGNETRRARSRPWPFLYFLDNGLGRPSTKRYLRNVRQGRVPLTYWSEAEYAEPFLLGSQSWEYRKSGHSQDGLQGLVKAVGKSHGFKTAKPMKLFKKIVQLWCPPDGTVLDPFAGSGTTGHAVLELNRETGANRRFQLIEQGNEKSKDKYARTLIVPRLQSALGNGADGGFEFYEVLKTKIDAAAIVALERSEMIDLIMQLHANGGGRRMLSGAGDRGDYLFARARNGKKEGYYLVWNAASKGKRKETVLNQNVYSRIKKEAQRAELTGKLHVYASKKTLDADNIVFHKIPESILLELGLG